MAKLVCKGTALQHSIASTLTDIAQIVSFDGPDAEVETVESDTLDNTAVGIPMSVTGRVTGGTVSGELFFDPSLAGHQDLTDQLLTPAVTNWNITWTDDTDWPFAGILKSCTPTVDLADLLKASFEIELSGIVTYPS